jgi:hypothetical protein
MHCVQQRIVGDAYPSNQCIPVLMHISCNCTIEMQLSSGACSYTFILVEPPQVGSLNPHKYLAVVLIGVLDIADKNELIFAGQSQVRIHSLLLNQYFVVIGGSMDIRCAFVVAILITRI